MNIILLSGGSGKRLWPLSNDIRSKQFVKLFKDEFGKNESMVQRVYRQIKMVDANANITIATSKTQASVIRNQLGENVSICVEPCRRDTFPAIVLATAYLHDVYNVDKNESVIVCPVDPYVGQSYFETIYKLDELVQEGIANITLMGINPTYPSEKYGYIIPKDSGEISDVKEFKEKPDVENAKKLLQQNAVWNAGVFAFKIEYLLKKAHSLLDFVDYYDLYEKYSTLKKISFDYEIVEKENRIQMMRYNGQWKDVGTWNMMAEVMSENSIGQAIIDDECVNTHVVNELNVPILAMGCKNMIIVAGRDGVLVSNKERSEYMKPYVERICDDIRYAEKSWGTYSVIDEGENSLTLKLLIKKGKSMSYHSHEFRKEVWTVISGKGIATIGDRNIEIKAGDNICVKPGEKHMISAKSDLEMIEVQIGSNITVDDKTKYERE